MSGKEKGRGVENEKIGVKKFRTKFETRDIGITFRKFGEVKISDQ